MASWKLLVLPALIISLLLMVPSHCIVDPTSTTLAISQATGTVCGITVRSQNHTVQCAHFPVSDHLTVPFVVKPNTSFDAIAGGRNFICGLRSGDSAIFCWDGIDQRVKRIYNGTTMLSLLSVGANHTAAIDEHRVQIKFWRYGCGQGGKICTKSKFPTLISGNYSSLTSGDDFSCALNATSSVHCWGPGAETIQGNFNSTRMSNVTAGGGRLCGLKETGHLLCSGDQSIVPSGEAFEFTSLAIGLSQTCAISRMNGSVICWVQHRSYFPMGNAKFESIVAGGDITCGITSYTFSVVCWGLDGTDLFEMRSLPRILPGVCVPKGTNCPCGVYSGSGDLCGRSGVICEKFGTATTGSCKFVPPKKKWKLLLNGWLGVLIAIVMLDLLLMSIFFSVILCAQLLGRII